MLPEPGYVYAGQRLLGRKSIKVGFTRVSATERLDATFGKGKAKLLFCVPAPWDDEGTLIYELGDHAVDGADIKLTAYPTETFYPHPYVFGILTEFHTFALRRRQPIRRTPPYNIWMPKRWGISPP